MAEKREVTIEKENKGLSIQDLILVAVLIAAGAVLKLTVASFLAYGGAKPNFMIATYCLAIILINPKGAKGILECLVIGLLVGLVSQIPMLNATPLVNFASEAIGAVVCGLLCMLFSNIAKNSFVAQGVVFPAINTFISTLFSGYSFCIIVAAVVSGMMAEQGLIAVLIFYIPMVVGTGAMNAVFAAIVCPILKKALKRD